MEARVCGNLKRETKRAFFVGGLALKQHLLILEYSILVSINLSKTQYVSIVYHNHYYNILVYLISYIK